MTPDKLHPDLIRGAALVLLLLGTFLVFKLLLMFDKSLKEEWVETDERERFGDPGDEEAPKS